MPKGVYQHKPCPEETRRKISEANKGRKVSEETKLKISNSEKGKIIPLAVRIKLSIIAKQQGYGKNRKGQISPMKGKKHTLQSLEKMKNSWFKKGSISWCKGTKGIVKAWNKGKKYPQFSGENHPNWKGGISNRPYSFLFNQQLKDKIRVRDNFICQLCKVPELECKSRLTIHHIDYNKKYCQENNLISLCRRCNTKVNFNRKYWISYFHNKMEEICQKN